MLFGQLCCKPSAKPATNMSNQQDVRKRAGEEGAGPLYLRVARTLKQEIIGGFFPVGAQLPTEGELCSRFAVSRHTVREALRTLREDNLVASRQGAGTVVITSRGQEDTYAHDIMSVDDLVSWAVGRRFGIESMELLPLSKELAAHCGLKRGESWLAVRGFGYEEGISVPTCLAEYYIHQDFASIGRLLPRHKGPIFPLIEDLFGVKVAEVHQTISATAIGAELSRALEVEPGSPGLRVQRSYRLSNRQVAQATVSTHPAARYQHSMTMRRVKT
jgi:GntR family transcriptional regulator